MSSDKLIFSKIASNGTESTVLTTIRDNSPISRTGIADKAALPQAAVSRSVANLLKNKVLIEKPLADTKGPRRKGGLHLNPSFGYCLAIEYSPNGIEGVAIDTSYNTILKKSENIGLKEISQDEKIRAINSFTEDIRAQTLSLPGKCLGMAIVDPGIIDDQTGVSLNSTIMDDWTNVAIVDILQQHFDLPMMLLNTSLAKIRAVDRLELRNTAKDLIYIEYGIGIGCGLKLAGNYISGQSNIAGEFGHIRITDSPISCRCGGVGCLESVAALPALEQDAKTALKQNNIKTGLAQLERVDGLAVLTAAAKGDRFAARIVDHAFEYLGRAAAGLVNVLNPEFVIFDNVINHAGKEAVSTLFRALNMNMLPSHSAKLNVQLSSIESHLGALGGAVAILDNCLKA